MKDETLTWGEVIAGTVCLFLLASSLIFLGHYLFPRTVDVNLLAGSEFSRGFEASCSLVHGTYAHKNGESSWSCTDSQSEISALKEKKTCDAAGGEFRMYDYTNPLIYHSYVIAEKGAPYEISCTKSYTEGNKDIKETVFNYKLQ